MLSYLYYILSLNMQFERSVEMADMWCQFGGYCAELAGGWQIPAWLRQTLTRLGEVLQIPAGNRYVLFKHFA